MSTAVKPHSGDSPPAEPALASLPSGSIRRQVLILALPLLGEQLGNFTIMLVDTFLAGQISDEATVGVGIGGYFGWFTNSGFAMVSLGAVALVSRAFGAGNIRLANRVMHQALLAGFAIGLVIAGGIFLVAPGASTWLTQTPQAEQICRTYLQTDAFGYALYSLLIVGSAILRAAGDTRTPMAIMILINIVNAFVSAALVYGWFGITLGVQGIAVGTVVARSLGGILAVWVLARGIRGMRLQRRRLVPRWRLQARMLRVSLPGAGDMSLMTMAQFLFVSIVARTATGDQATSNLAAHVIAMRAEALTYLPAVAWMTAAGTMVGQYLGAEQPHKAARSGHTAALQSAALTTVSGIMFFIFAEAIYKFMSNEPAVWEVGVPAFRIMAFVQPFLCIAIVYTGALRGAGDTTSTMIFSLVGSWALRVPLAWLFGVYMGWGLIGAWYGMWADNLAKFAMSTGRFSQGGWKRVKV
jgi:putative MATE family efflux protein